MVKRNIGQILEELRDLDTQDCESAHSDADDLLLEALEILGQDELVRVFREACESIPFWYA